MAHLDPLATVHLPVRADGRLIKNAFGVIVAEVKGDGFLAEAVAALINYGEAPAREQNEAQERQYQARLKWINSVGPMCPETT